MICQTCRTPFEDDGEGGFVHVDPTVARHAPVPWGQGRQKTKGAARAEVAMQWDAEHVDKGEPPDYDGAKPGNFLGVTTGATSPRLVSERARQVHAELLPYAPQLQDPPTQLLTEDLCRVEAIAEMLYENILEEAAKSKRGIGGVPTTRLQRFIEATGRKGRILDAMGLSPQAKAKMVKEASDAELNKVKLADDLRKGLGEGRSLTQKAIAEGRLSVEAEDVEEAQG